MTLKTTNTTHPGTPVFCKAGLLFAFCLILLLPAAHAQNSKGDRPARENRFTLKKSSSKRKSPSRRVKSRSTGARAANMYSKMGRSQSAKHNNVFPQRTMSPARGGRDHAGKSIRPVYTQHQPKSHQKAWRGDISGHKIRAGAAPSGRPKNVYPQRGPTVRGATSPHSESRPVSNRAALSRLKNLQSPQSPRPGRKRKVVPRSASASFIARGGPHRWAKFPQRHRKGETAVMTDLAGKPLRSRNFQSQRPAIQGNATNSNTPRRRVGDRPYTGRGGGSAHRAARPGDHHGWTSGDIASRRIRGRNRFSKGKRTEHVGRQSGGFSSRTRTGRVGKSLPPRAPGMGAQGIGGFKGWQKGQRPLKGGGSASGKLWNNRGQALAPRTPGMGANGLGYSGFQKGRRPLKGGGSASGRLWNNRGQALAPRTPGMGANGVGYSGFQKGRRPIKGGGSVSGRLWNNRQRSVAVRPPSQNAMKAGGFPGRIRRFSVQPGFRDQGEGFTGTRKAYKPEKGGGSVSGRLWNNRNKALPAKVPGPGTIVGGQWRGDTKTGRPAKGGGSVSGKLWNNKESAIPTRIPPAGAEKVGGFPGKMKRFSVQPGFSDQGEEFKGVLRTPWYRRAYSRNPNAHEKATRQKSPDRTTYQVGNLQVPVKQRKYIKNPNAAEDATPKQKPTESTIAAGELQVKVKRRPYVTNDNSAEDALKKLKPTESTIAAGELQIKMKRRAYVRNPNSAEEALRKLKPTESTLTVDGLQIKVRQHPYGRKPHAAEGALPGWKPSKETTEASQYARGVRKTWSYIHNASSSKDALRVREPGRAVARSTDYQGNIKMKKFDLFEKTNLHPDAKFVKINKNNVASERDMVTNFKLWWSKLFFKKNETLPDHLKDKGRKPRYDKGEQGLWND